MTNKFLFKTPLQELSFSTLGTHWIQVQKRSEGTIRKFNKSSILATPNLIQVHLFTLLFLVSPSLELLGTEGATEKEVQYTHHPYESIVS